uniref:Uncharacterized protein n=1 Tax=Calhevirus-2a TaxID=1506579 RepID=A0A097ZPG5_9VIRU|nr:hypothetical protein [Calhevirus-2a]
MNTDFPAQVTLLGYLHQVFSYFSRNLALDRLQLRRLYRIEALTWSDIKIYLSIFFLHLRLLFIDLRFAGSVARIELTHACKQLRQNRLELSRRVSESNQIIRKKIVRHFDELDTSIQESNHRIRSHFERFAQQCRDFDQSTQQKIREAFSPKKKKVRPEITHLIQTAVPLGPCILTGKPPSKNKKIGPCVAKIDDCVFLPEGFIICHYRLKKPQLTLRHTLLTSADSQVQTYLTGLKSSVTKPSLAKELSSLPPQQELPYL